MPNLTDIADAYAVLEHAPHLPHVQNAYAHLRRELLAQFDVLTAYVDVQFTADNPYISSAAMFEDIAHRRQLLVYTDADIPPNHPMAEPINLGHQWVTLNSVFRAVHDGIAHFPKRLSFGPTGEYRAFQEHCRLLSPLAGWALATETLGQNAFFNFGPYRFIPAKERPYPPQKANLLEFALIAPHFPEGVL